MFKANILINDSHRACLADFGLPAILYKTKMVYTLPNTHPYLRTRNNAVDWRQSSLMSLAHESN